LSWHENFQPTAEELAEITDAMRAALPDTPDVEAYALGILYSRFCAAKLASSHKRNMKGLKRGKTTLQSLLKKGTHAR
jgi:hypothetical protein